MKKAILLSIIIALTTFSAFPKTKQESIKQLFSLMKTESLFENFALPMMRNDSTSKALASSSMALIKPMIIKIMNEDLVQLYDQYYTKKEINDMIGFYKSKTGQKMVTTSPKLQTELMKIVMTKYMGEIFNKINHSH